MEDENKQQPSFLDQIGTGFGIGTRPEPIQPYKIPEPAFKVSVGTGGEQKDDLQQVDEALSAVQQVEQQKTAQEFDQFNKFQAAQQRYNAVKQKSEKLGIGVQLPEPPKPEQFGLKAETVAKFVDPQFQAEAAKAAADRKAKEDQERALQQEQQKALEQKATQDIYESFASRQIAREQGVLAAQQRAAAKREELMNEQFRLYDERQSQLDKIDPNRFWNSQSTFQKILGTVAIALGEVGKALTKGTENPALKIINQAIEDDINAQKVSNEQKLQLKDQALKRVGLEIQRYQAMADDAEKQARLQQTIDQINMQRENLRVQSVQRKAVLAQLYGEGLDPRVADEVLTEEERRRKVVLPNGLIKVAATQKHQENLVQVQGEMTTAKALAAQLKKEFSDFTVFDKMPLNEKKARVESMMQALTGALRVPITGPGVMNEQEYKRIVDGILGSPTDWLSVPHMTRVKLDALNNILDSMERARYKSAGVELPVDENTKKADQLLMEMVRRGKDKGISEQQIIKLYSR